MSTLLSQVDTPATDTVWRLQTHWTFAPWLTVLLITASAALIAYCYARERSPAGLAYRGLLGLLRMTTVALILIMLSELLLAGVRSGRPRFNWLFDLSGSMATVDAESASGASRLATAQAALLADDADLLRRIAQNYDAQLTATPGDSVPTVGEAPQEVVAALKANEQSLTPLGDAISRLVNPATAAPPQAMAIVTDGRTTSGASLASAADAAARSGTRLFFLGVGSSQAPPDIALSDPLADEVVFVDDLVSLGATLRIEGDLQQPVRVRLTSDGDPTLLAEATVQPDVDRRSVAVQLIDRPTEPGDIRYRMEAIPVEGERDTENNAVTFDVQVREARVSVLLAAGYPMYEYRYLKNLLERDSTVDLTTYLQEADIQYSVADETAINRFPLRQSELDQHDVILLLDMDPRLLPRSAWGELAEHVSDGGGLAIVAGARYLPIAYRGLADFQALCPTLLSTAPLSNPLNAAYRVQPTELGMRTAPFQLLDDTAESADAWRALTPLYWAADLGDPKPTAQVLATHPTEVQADGKPLPLIVTQYYGSGQVLLHGFDASYLWRKRVGDVYFARYWVQSIRRLAHGRLKRDDRGWELTVGRGEYQLGEPVRIRLRTPGDAAQAATVLVQPEGGPQLRLQLTPSPVQPGVLEGELRDLPVGRYRALLAGADSEAVGAAFQIVSPPGEFAKLEADIAGMKAAAQRTGGVYLPIEQAQELLEQLPRADRVPIESLPPVELWNRWWMLAGICGCLTTEWILRKRKAML